MNDEMAVYIYPLKSMKTTSAQFIYTCIKQSNCWRLFEVCQMAALETLLFSRNHVGALA